MGRIPEGSMSTQGQRALLLRLSVAEFERRINALLDYEEAYSQATLEEETTKWHRHHEIRETYLRNRSMSRYERP
jgi:hypothetical protein